ncbi:MULTISPECIES: class I SAM-dependent methyltransferase [Nostocales]|uniref:MerR family transcriptional regulator n=3 Tax=Nostocales TaxID=1161 RepID=A0A0C1N921_9CYAN|nr:methyltransferase domain-containing protein [Tolypothrix bouteillei]KAF3885171.1 methyltransferase domain-containing protein [Tolypothrix bouteillei VB521301]
MPIYDSIGQQYSTTRIPDSRIVNTLVNLLNLPKGNTIADLGAGTGSYSLALAARGFSVCAIEPSLVMQTQALEHPDIKWITGCAEAIPLPDRSVDGLISVLAIHHFSDLEKAICEMHRVVKSGAIVLLTFDIRLAEKIWLYDYFPWLWEDALRFLPLQELTNLIQASTNRNVETIPFLLPHDLSDLFAAAAWRRPELYLQPEVRAGISSFALANSHLIAPAVQSLAADLSNGQWDAKYGKIRQVAEIDVGYRFLRATIEE